MKTKLVEPSARTGTAAIMAGLMLAAVSAEAQSIYRADESPLCPETGLSPLMEPEESLTVPLRVAPPRLDAQYGRARLHFERNDGQVDAEVKFLARGPGYNLFLTQTEAVMVLSEGPRGGSFDVPPKSWWGEAPAELWSEREVGSAGASHHRSGAGADAAGTGGSSASHSLRMRLVGAKPAPLVRGQDELRGKVNYFLGNDPSLWRTNISTFAKVRFREVYPGIDLVYYGNQRELEYDFVVAPGADPDAIKLAFEGADKIEVDDAGELILQVSGRQVRWHCPRVYQDLNGARHEIAAAYRLNLPGENPAPGKVPQVAFRVAAYDPAQPLVIDPTLVYGTFLGGSNQFSYAYGIAVDRNGNAYGAGYTRSAQFPTKNPLQSATGGNDDLFITKLDSTGQLVYSTYIGGTGDDSGRGIAVDAAGSAYVVGYTTSRNFPVANALQANFGGGSGDAFVLKLSPTGTALVYSTYLGGSGGLGQSTDEAAFAVAVDSTGNAYVCGSTPSANFPTTNAVQARYGGLIDSFIAKLNPAGTALVYCTYLGGSEFDRAAAVIVGEQGSAYVSGFTASDDFPTKSPFQPNRAGGYDGFLAKLNPTGDALLFSSYFGGSAYDRIGSIALGSDGDIYLAGDTGSGDFPTANALQPGKNGDHDGFVARYNPRSNDLTFSTYLGGSGYDFASLALDAANHVHVTGSTTSVDFPITADALQPSFAGGGPQYGDAVLSVLSSDGARLIYSSYLGGSGSDVAWCVALDQAGNVYLGGQTTSTDFPVQNPIVPNPFAGQTAALVVKFSPVVEGSFPALKVIRSGGTLLITWPASVAGAILEAADSLPATAGWVQVGVAPVIIGDQSTVTVDIEGSARFFRLRKP